HCDRWNESGTQAAEKQENDNHDEHKGDQERDQHVMDRVVYEDRRVVIDQVSETRREALAQPIHCGIDLRSRRHRIRAWRKGYPDRDRRLTVEMGFDILVLSAELHPCYISHAEQRPVGISAQHNIAELFRRGETALRLQVHLELLVVADRPSADATDWRLHILRLDRRNDIRGRQL